MQYIPKIKVPTASLAVADLGKDKLDGQIAACVLQGIVNRDREDKIYVVNTYCADNGGDWQKRDLAPDSRHMAHVARQWLEEVYGDLPQTEVLPAADEEYPMLLSLLEAYKDSIKGVIVYDLRLPDATIKAATTIAGQTDGIVVSPMLLKRLAGYGFPVIEDLRAYCFDSNLRVLDWLKDKYFAAANKTVGFTWSHMDLTQKSWGAANKDYVVANRLFTYYLDIENEEERAHYGDIVYEYPMGTPILGWTDELVADAMLAKMGYFMIPFISVENMTVASSFPTASLAPPALPEIELDENAVYLAFHIADGDNLLHSLVYEPFTIRRDPAFGKVPATWVLNPIMAELAPRAMEWHTKTLLAAGQEPAAMLGDGSPNSERYAGFRYYCDFVRHFLGLAGMRTMKQMLEGEPVAWNVKPGVVLGGYAGRDYRGIGPYEYHLDDETFHMGSIPLGERDFVALIRNAPAGKPLFLSIFSATASIPVCSRIAAYAKEWKEKLPDKKLYFVTAAQAAAVYKKWVAQRAYAKRDAE